MNIVFDALVVIGVISTVVWVAFILDQALQLFADIRMRKTQWAKLQQDIKGLHQDLDGLRDRLNKARIK
jgi:hypothetical protein